MANKYKGEVDLTAGEKTYKIRFSANALVELEDAMDMGINAVASHLQQILKDPNNIRIKTVRAILWAGLLDHQPGTTLKQAGDILTEATIARSMDAVTKAFNLMFSEKESVKVRPPKPGSSPAVAEETAPGIGMHS